MKRRARRAVQRILNHKTLAITLENCHQPTQDAGTPDGNRECAKERWTHAFK